MTYNAFDLSGKVATITGGNSGIGLGMAEALAQAGAAVCIWGTNEAKNAAAIETLRAHGTKAHALRCDVGQSDQGIMPMIGHSESSICGCNGCSAFGS